MVEAPNAKCGGVNSQTMPHKLQTRGQLEDFIITLAHSLISTGMCQGLCWVLSNNNESTWKEAAGRAHTPWPSNSTPRYRLNGNAGMCTPEDMSSNLTAARVLSPIQSGWDQKCGRFQISSDVGIGRIWWFPRDRVHT